MKIRFKKKKAKEMKNLNTVICYKNEEEVIEYANNLYQQNYSQDIVLVVVINESGIMATNIFESLLNSIGIEILICFPKENIGYLNGMIYGYKMYMETKKSMPEWVIMSNTDIDFKDSSVIERLINSKYSSDIWCVGPAIYSPSKNTYDNPICIERRTIQRINFLIFVFSHSWLAAKYFKLSEIKSKIKSKKNKCCQKSQLVYEVHGCFFIIRNEFAKILSNKGYEAFLFSEEAFIAELVRANNKFIFYDEDLEIIHKEHSVTNKLFINKKAAFYADSLKVIKNEFYLKK